MTQDRRPRATSRRLIQHAQMALDFNGATERKVLRDKTFTAATIFSGIGGGAIGLQRAGFRLVGAIDYEEAICADYEYLTGSPCTVGDLATMEVDAFRACFSERPDLLLTSSPCTGFSSCLPAKMAKQDKYLKFNSLSVRGIFLMLEAFEDDPIPVVLLENVPRIMSAGAEHLRQIVALLHAYGYEVAQTTHDCGELGGLAQHRRRFLMIARHRGTVETPIYVPPVKRVRGVGEVIYQLPIPTGEVGPAGPMHVLNSASPLNLLRLAAILAGGDWRTLPKSIALKERAARQNGQYGVNDPQEGAHTVIATATYAATWASVADERVDGNVNPQLRCSPRGTVYGVVGDDSASGTVLAAARPDNGAFSVADARVSVVRVDEINPRIKRPRREGSLGVKGADDAATAIIGACSIQNHPSSVADERVKTELGYSPRKGAMGVLGDEEPSTTIIGESRSNKGANVADVRIKSSGDTHAGKYGVIRDDEASGAIIGASSLTTARSSFADARLDAITPTHHLVREEDGSLTLVGPPLDLSERGRPVNDVVILSPDGTWHRPMTTLELLALQGFPLEVNGEPVSLGGNSQKEHRKRIGNAIPPPTAEAIGRAALSTLAAVVGGYALVCMEPIWVTPQVSMSLDASDTVSLEVVWCRDLETGAAARPPAPKQHHAVMPGWLRLDGWMDGGLDWMDGGAAAFH